MDKNDKIGMLPIVEDIAVLFTDLQGSTKWLYYKKPEIVIPALKYYFNILYEIFREKGEIVKRMGDGVMAVFSNLEDAIRAGVSLQQRMAKERSDETRPFLIPPTRIGISAGQASRIELPKEEIDYFGQVCAEASRISDLADGYHILVAAKSLPLVKFSQFAMEKDGLKFSETVRVYRRGLDEVDVCEVLYRPEDKGIVKDPPSPDVTEDGYIKKQIISRSRPDIAPFSYYENSDKAEFDVDAFLLRSSQFNFLHIRGIVRGSSSPFNRFVKLIADKKFVEPESKEIRQIDSVCVVILDPNGPWLKNYYMKERGCNEKRTDHRIGECKLALEVAKNRLERFQVEGYIKSWKILLSNQDPIWRLAITENGVIATPYGGKQRTIDNIVLFAESTEDPIYKSLNRLYNNIASISVPYASSD